MGVGWGCTPIARTSTRSGMGKPAASASAHTQQRVAMQAQRGHLVPISEAAGGEEGGCKQQPSTLHRVSKLVSAHAVRPQHGASATWGGAKTRGAVAGDQQGSAHDKRCHSRGCLCRAAGAASERADSDSKNQQKCMSISTKATTMRVRTMAGAAMAAAALGGAGVAAAGAAAHAA